jgi:short subunit dehydrogenase-like uncharacterized protein
MIGRPSPGTVKSFLGMLPSGAWVRRGGRLRRIPFGSGMRQVRFPERSAWVVPMELADLETAYRSTGAGDITVMTTLPGSLVRWLRIGWPAAAAGLALARPLLRSRAFQERARRWAEANVSGADQARRARTRTFVWARAEGGGRSKEAWLECPDGYDFTSHAALNAVRAVLERAPAGATTPALAFGADFTLAVPGTRRLDALPPP